MQEQFSGVWTTIVSLVSPTPTSIVRAASKRIHMLRVSMLGACLSLAMPEIEMTSKCVDGDTLEVRCGAVVTLRGAGWCW